MTGRHPTLTRKPAFELFLTLTLTLTVTFILRSTAVAAIILLRYGLAFARSLAVPHPVRAPEAVDHQSIEPSIGTLSATAVEAPAGQDVPKDVPLAFVNEAK